MHNFILFILYIRISTSSTSFGLKDQFFPRRLDRADNRSDLFKPDSRDTKSDPSLGLSSDLNSASNLDLVKTSSTECAIVCFILVTNRDLVDCRSSQVWKSDATISSLQPISCEHHVETGELILGRKDSIRSLVPGSLRALLLPGNRDLTRTGQLYVQLNLNMVYLDAGTFRGMGGLITDVRILNTVYMHPDSLLDLQRLRFFEIDSGKPPKLLRNESMLDLNFKPSANEVANQNGMFYLRLKPVDMTAPITFNLNVECYRCATLNLSFENLIVIRFRQPSGRLNVIYPQSCPVRSNTIGCPTSLSTDDNLIDNEHPSDLEKLTPTDTLMNSANESMPLKQTNNELSLNTASSSQQSLTIALSIWCTILTIIFIGIIILIFFCSRRHFDPKHQFSIPFLDRFGQRPFSIEETSSDSASFGFYPSNQQHHQSTKSIQPESNHLLVNNLMTDSQSSFNTLNMPNGRSTSVHSLRDKSMRSRYYYLHNNNYNSLSRSRRSKHMETRNRSIGSQTDFTDLDSDMNTYSTLGPSTERYKSGRVQDPPRRTASHQFLPYSSKNPDRWDGLVFHQAHFIPRRERNSYSGHEVNPDLLILMIDGKPTSHPPIRSLPPVHPIPKSIMNSNTMTGINSTIYSGSSRPVLNA